MILNFSSIVDSARPIISNIVVTNVEITTLAYRFKSGLEHQSLFVVSY